MARARDATDESTGRSAERCRQVLDAASECFARDGFHGTSMAQLAEAAGMSVGHIYHYFENKEAIIAAIVRREAAHKLELFGELGKRVDVLDALLERAAPALDARLDDGQAALRLEVLAEASRNAGVAKVVRAADETTRVTFRELLAKALGERSGLTPQQLEARAEVLIALFDGLTIRAVRHPDLDRAATADALRFAMRALLAPAPGRRG